MRKLILDLLDLTRIESGQKRRELVQVDLAQAAQRAADAVLPFASARGIAVEISAAPAAVMLADAAELEMLLQQPRHQRREVQPGRRQGGVRVARRGWEGRALGLRHGHRHDPGGGGPPLRRVRPHQERPRPATSPAAASASPSSRSSPRSTAARSAWRANRAWAPPSPSAWKPSGGKRREARPRRDPRLAAGRERRAPRGALGRRRRHAAERRGRRGAPARPGGDLQPLRAPLRLLRHQRRQPGRSCATA